MGAITSLANEEKNGWFRFTESHNEKSSLEIYSKYLYKLRESRTLAVMSGNMKRIGSKQGERTDRRCQFVIRNEPQRRSSGGLKYARFLIEDFRIRIRGKTLKPLVNFAFSSSSAKKKLGVNVHGEVFSYNFADARRAISALEKLPDVELRLIFMKKRYNENSRSRRCFR